MHKVSVSLKQLE